MNRITQRIQNAARMRNLPARTTRLLTLCLVAAAWHARAMDSATTPPAGCVKLPLAGGGDSHLVTPLARRPAAMAVLAQAPASNVLVVAGEPWTAGAFAADPLLGPRFAAEFFSGPLEGAAYPVLANDAGTLLVDTVRQPLAGHPLGAAAAGDVLVVRPLWTVETVFEGTHTPPVLAPSADVPEPGAWDAADSVRLPSGGAFDFFCPPERVLAPLEGGGWAARLGETNLAQATGHPLDDSSAFTVRRFSSAPAEIWLLGDARVRRFVVPIPAAGPAGAAQLVGWAMADPVDLASASLTLGGTNAPVRVSASLAQRADEWRGFSAGRTGFQLPPDRLFVWTTQGFWREAGSEDIAIPGETELAPGAAWLLWRRPGSGPAFWVQAPTAE